MLTTVVGPYYTSGTLPARTWVHQQRLPDLMTVWTLVGWRLQVSVNKCLFRISACFPICSIWSKHRAERSLVVKASCLIAVCRRCQNTRVMFHSQDFRASKAARRNTSGIPWQSNRQLNEIEQPACAGQVRAADASLNKQYWTTPGGHHATVCPHGCLRYYARSWINEWDNICTVTVAPVWSTALTMHQI